VIPYERDFLINPNHPEFSKITIHSPQLTATVASGPQDFSGDCADRNAARHRPSHVKAGGMPQSGLHTMRDV